MGLAWASGHTVSVRVHRQGTSFMQNHIVYIGCKNTKMEKIESDMRGEEDVLGE